VWKQPKRETGERKYNVERGGGTKERTPTKIGKREKRNTFGMPKYFWD